MGKEIYTGVSGVARHVTQPYIGVGGVSRSVTNGYIGVSGVARQFWQDGLWLYNYGKSDYTVATRSYSGNGTTRGTISTNCCYINSTYMLADTYGNSDIDSYLGCPSFVISGVSEINATDIAKYTKLECTYEIGTATSTAIDDTVISFGGWAGWEWSYDSDLETKGNAYYWKCSVTHEKGETGTFTKTFDITSTKTGGLYWFLTYPGYCTTSSYKTKATNFYFGAWNYKKGGSDYREWYCRVPVYFYSIRLL